MNKGLFFILFIGLISCSKEKVPDEYMTENEMAMVLMDIYIAEGRLSFKNSPIKTMDIYPTYKEFILEKYDISDSVYHANMSYYITHPKTMDRVYEIVIDSLKLRRQAIPGSPLL